MISYNYTQCPRKMLHSLILFRRGEGKKRKKPTIFFLVLLSVKKKTNKNLLRWPFIREISDKCSGVTI